MIWPAPSNERLSKIFPCIQALIGGEAPAMIEKRIPVTKVGRFDFVVKKNSARHGAFAEPSEVVVSLVGSDNLAE